MTPIFDSFRMEARCWIDYEKTVFRASSYITHTRTERESVCVCIRVE
jgi:hypothetical protein